MDLLLEPKPESPYLSVVVCSRNDDHGGDLIRRMQTFIDGLSMQSTKYGLNAELVIVEWNPPDATPRLSSMLRFPGRESTLSTRTIEVPGTVHRTFAHSDQLPLFQMIAKNVGIRAAKGKFVLATNVDILFSDELISFLADKKLLGGRYYRVDRYDVPSDVPEKGSIEEELSYSRKNVLRICKKDATIDYVTGTVMRIYPDTKGFKKVHAFLWAVGILLVFNFLSLRLSRVRRRKVSSSGLRRDRTPAVEKIGRVWMRMRKERLNVGTRFPNVLPLKWFDVVLGRLEALLLRSLSVKVAFTRPRSTSKVMGVLLDLLTLPPPSRPSLFTNASGDFTLMSKNDWAKIRGYPEMQMFSMHLDSLLLYVAHYAGVQETYLDYPIYHIDHSKGWSPLNAGGFYEEVQRKGIPILSYEEFLVLTDRMVKTKRAFIFNDENWGLSSEIIPEKVGMEKMTSVPTGGRDRAAVPSL